MQTIAFDAAAMAPMLGKKEVYDAMLDAMHERRGPNENSHVLQLRLRRALQGSPVTVRVHNARSRVPAELAFIERTLHEVDRYVTVTMDADGPPQGDALLEPRSASPPL